MLRAGADLSAFMALILAMLALGACTSTRETSPQRSATEQLLISTAVDRVVEGMDLKIPQGTKVFLDAEQLEGSDGKYASGAMKDRLLRDGANLVGDRGKADAVVEIRAGALSIDDKQTLVGIGSFDVRSRWPARPPRFPRSRSTSRRSAWASPRSRPSATAPATAS